MPRTWDIGVATPQSGRRLKEDGTAVNITNNGLDVNVSDQTTEIVDLHLTEQIQVMTLVNNTVMDQTVIRVASASPPIAFNMVNLKEGTSFYQGEILVVASLGGGQYNLTLDTPLDFAYTTAALIDEVSDDLTVNGSSTRIIFNISPAGLAPGTRWDIIRMIFVITDNTAMDDEKFGGLAALSKGIVIRKTSGKNKNIFNAKTNSDFAVHTFDISYSDKAPSGFFGFRARRTFGGQDKNGVVIRLSADTNDELEVIIQDNLSGLTRFNVVAQGHVVEDLKVVE